MDPNEYPTPDELLEEAGIRARAQRIANKAFQRLQPDCPRFQALRVDQHARADGCLADDGSHVFVRARKTDAEGHEELFGRPVDVTWSGIMSLLVACWSLSTSDVGGLRPKRPRQLFKVGLLQRSNKQHLVPSLERTIESCVRRPQVHELEQV
jgi:hypothetical protein